MSAGLRAARRLVGIASFHAGTLARSRSLRRGRLEEAARHAGEMLRTAQDDPDDWNSGNLLHHGHLLLGRVAYERGDLEGAEAGLLAAAAAPGSPQLATFGPNMALADA